MSITFKSANSITAERGLATELDAELPKANFVRRCAPMKIAMIGVKGVPHPGGIENVVEELGTRLVAKGHEVSVYVRPHYTRSTLKEFRGMRLVNLPSIPTKHFDAISHTLVATAHAMFSGAAIAHVHSIGLSPFALPLKLRGIKTVVQSHGLDWQRGKWGPLAKTYLKASDRGAVFFPDATTVVSRKMKHYYENTFCRPVTYIPNGVDVYPRVPPQQILELGLRGDDYVLFASRLVREKGLHYLLDAYEQIPNPRKKLVIAGDSNYGDQYAATLKKRGNQNVLFLGFATGQLFRELLSCSYCYVLPSDIEGLSTGLLQAMSYGNCVLVSDIAENCEVIGENGLSFKQGNVKDLKQKLELLLDCEDIVEEYRSRASEYVRKNYNWDDVAEEYESLYCRLLQAEVA
jgi:glycosyltransferase involved in cell wall biosynthesis